MWLKHWDLRLSCQSLHGHWGWFHCFSWGDRYAFLSFYYWRFLKLDLLERRQHMFNYSVVSNSLHPHGLHCPLPSPGVSSNSCPLSWWCHPTISSSIIPFSSCLHSFPLSGSYPMSQLFTSGGQIIGASASASVLPIKIQLWFPLRLTGLISLLSNGLSRVFSSTTVQRHQFFGIQPFLLFISHIHTRLLEKP